MGPVGRLNKPPRFVFSRVKGFVGFYGSVFGGGSVSGTANSGLLGFGGLYGFMSISDR